MVRNKKQIMAAAILALIPMSFNIAEADSLSNLLQMDVKRSSIANTVDVTFYTTGIQSNSVVTRKGNNRYVVLLPNTASSSSIAPGIGGVKDLITDVNVKHVDDGIGGYTKVTFGTTKPINIKTHMKKTNPLTQAQKDSQAIIAKNSIKPTITQQQKTHTTTTSQSKVENTTTTKPIKQVQKVQKPSEPINAVSNVKNTIQKAVSVPKISLKPKSVERKQKVESPQSKAVQTKSKVENTPAKHFEPKMKFDENGKRIIDLEPRISHNVETSTVVNSNVKVDPLFSIEDIKTKVESTSKKVENSESAIDTPITEQTTTHKYLPYWVLLAGGIFVGLSILYLILDAMRNANNKDKSRLESFYKMSSHNSIKRKKREYYDIVNNEDLNWQEKYKLYSEKEEKQKVNKNESAMSYITDMSGLKKAIIEPINNEIQQSNNETQSLNLGIKNRDDSLNNNKTKTHEEIVREKLQAKISQMEHSLSQVSSKEPEEISNEVRSEDSSIMNNFSDIKLKAFAKPMSLSQSQRSIGEDEKSSRNKSYKEGRFVKLKNSPLSVCRRKSFGSNLEVSDLIGTGSKYLTNNGVTNMSKENENYLMSSLNSFLSLMDSDKSSSASVSRAASNLAQMKSSASEAMSRSGVTNPISRASNPISKMSNSQQNTSSYMNGLIVKSGYNIDAERGIYVVNIDGVSALVGRIKENIFVLKKFDHVVDKPIQVRQDDANVYIVRVGKFKCLVDVSKDRMGTLIEI